MITTFRANPMYLRQTWMRAAARCTPLQTPTGNSARCLESSHECQSSSVKTSYSRRFRKNLVICNRWSSGMSPQSSCLRPARTFSQRSTSCSLRLPLRSCLKWSQCTELSSRTYRPMQCKVSLVLPSSLAATIWSYRRLKPFRTLFKSQIKITSTRFSRNANLALRFTLSRYAVWQTSKKATMSWMAIMYRLSLRLQRRSTQTRISSKTTHLLQVMGPTSTFS